MKKLLILMSICTSLSFLGCSLKQTEISSSKSIIATKESINIDQETPVTKAIMNYYGDESEPILINEEIPFENGTLVLAEELGDGEIYPNLHFIDESGNVASLTGNSYCWTLNYTQFKGYNIFFGFAGTETREYHKDVSPVKKVEAIFSDKTESVIPKEKAIACLNPKGKKLNRDGGSHGYIMPVKGKKMPNDLVATFENGNKVSLCEKTIGEGIYMPDYFKVERADIYNSYAFTFCPMLTPREWEQGYKKGESFRLKSEPDKRGNENELYLKLVGFMKSTDSFILPQDIKSLYLSANDCNIEKFSAGEIMEVEYPHERKFVDCRILKLTKEMVDKEIDQDCLGLININEKNQLMLPNERGYYLFLLRIEKEDEIQTYTNVFQIVDKEQK